MPGCDYGCGGCIAVSTHQSGSPIGQSVPADGPHLLHMQITTNRGIVWFAAELVCERVIDLWAGLGAVEDSEQARD